MQCVIIFTCVLAAASAGYTVHGSHHYSAPVISHNSYSYSAPVNHGYSHAAPIAYGYSHAAPIAHEYAHVGHYGSEVRLVDPVAVAAGAPLPVGDTHEVAIAKAAHFKAHAIANERLHSSALGHGYTYAAPVSYGYGQSAPEAHGYSHAAPIAHGYAHVGHYGSEPRLVDTAAIAAGAPLPVGDTHEVAIAKAAHFKAHAVAKERLHASPIVHSYSPVAPVAHGYAHGYAHAAPVVHGYAHGYAHAAPVVHGYVNGGHYGSEARLVDPVAIAAGAPLPGGDTHEVAAAKAAHLKAHAAAKSGHFGSYYG